MMEKRATKFPIASIFITVSTLLGLLNGIYMIYIMYLNGTINLVYYIFWIPSIGINIALAVFLFLRKRNNLLFAILIAQVLLNVLSFISNASWYNRISAIYNLFVFSPLLTAVAFLFFALESKTLIPPEDEGRKGFLRKTWFFPGLIIIAAELAELIVFEPSKDFFGVLMMISELCYVLFAFLLGWWLTDPYKKATQGQPQYRWSSPPMTAGYSPIKKVYCTGCGRELPSDEDFCAICGTPRRMPSGFPSENSSTYGGHFDL